jgi:uncharacterized protein (TIGR02145 family)
MKHLIICILAIALIGPSALSGQALKDIDGNVYRTVKIGSQTWMAENLKTTRLTDGSVISLIKDDNEWAGSSSSAYCWFKNDGSTYKNKYGALYNWYAVNTGKLCPAGWHVPSDADWTILTDFLGGEDVAGGKLKKADTLSWQNPNTGATNASGFTAVSTGFRNHAGSFDLYGSNNIYFRSNGFYWSSTEKYSFNAYYRRLYNSLASIYRSLSAKEFGYSVRCLKD